MTLRQILHSLSGEFFRTLAGGLWYVLAATLGLALIGAVALARTLLRPDRPRVLPAWCSAVYLLALPASMLLISTSYMAGWLWAHPRDPRADHLFYGRYVDAVLPALICLGACWALTAERGRSRRRVAAGVAIASAGLGLLSLAWSSLRGDRTVSRVTVGGVYWLIADQDGGLRPVALVAVAVLGTAALSLFVLTVLRDGLGRWAGAALVLCFFAAGSFSALTVNRQANQLTFDAIPGYLALRDRHAGVVAYDLDDRTVWGYFGLPYWLNRSEFVMFHPSAGQWPRADLYVGPARWPAAAAHGLRQIYLDPLSRQSFWVPVAGN